MGLGTKVIDGQRQIHARGAAHSDDGAEANRTLGRPVQYRRAESPRLHDKGCGPGCRYHVRCAYVETWRHKGSSEEQMKG